MDNFSGFEVRAEIYPACLIMLALGLRLVVEATGGKDHLYS